MRPDYLYEYAEPKKESVALRFICVLLLFLYLALTVWILLFKFENPKALNLQESVNPRLMDYLQNKDLAGREIIFNAKPLATINKMIDLLGDSDYRRWALLNLAGNIIAFIPLGILVPFVKGGKRYILLTLTFIILLTLGIEGTQLYTGWGVFDVDDLLLNFCGGIIGLLLFVFCQLIFGYGFNRRQIDVSRRVSNSLPPARRRSPKVKEPTLLQTLMTKDKALEQELDPRFYDPGYTRYNDNYDYSYDYSEGDYVGAETAYETEYEYTYDYDHDYNYDYDYDYYYQYEEYAPANDTPASEMQGKRIVEQRNLTQSKRYRDRPLNVKRVKPLQYKVKTREVSHDGVD